MHSSLHGADANHGNLYAGLLLDEGDIVLRGLGQILKAPHTGNILRPALKFLINGLHLRQHGQRRGVVIVNLASVFIARADLDLIDAAQSVHSGEGEGGNPAGADGKAQNHQIQPAAAPRPPRYRAIFMAFVADGIPHFVKELRHKGALAYPGGIRLHDPYNLVNGLGPDACAHGDASCRGVRGRHVGIGAIVQIQQHALSALEEELLARLLGLVNHEGGIRHHGSQLFAIAQIVLQHLVIIQGLAAVNLRNQLVFLRQNRFELLGKAVLIQQVHHAEADPAGLIRIAGANAVFGGADYLIPQALLRKPVQHLVIGHDEMGPVADEKIVRLNALFVQICDFVEQGARVYDHAVADNGRLPRRKNARRNGAQLKLHPVYIDGVSRVISPLIPDDHIGLCRQKIYKSAFAFVAPLGPEYYHSGHTVHFLCHISAQRTPLVSYQFSPYSSTKKAGKPLFPSFWAG